MMLQKKNTDADGDLCACVSECRLARMSETCTQGGISDPFDAGIVLFCYFISPQTCRVVDSSKAISVWKQDDCTCME
jgi:hypothetical protein